MMENWKTYYFEGFNVTIDGVQYELTEENHIINHKDKIYLIYGKERPDEYVDTFRRMVDVTDNIFYTDLMVALHTDGETVVWERYMDHKARRTLLNNYTYEYDFGYITVTQVPLPRKGLTSASNTEGYVMWQKATQLIPV